jgi:hypothetical protein
MSRKPTLTVLPDLDEDDEAFRRKMLPLVGQLPADRSHVGPSARPTGGPDIRDTGDQASVGAASAAATRTTGIPDVRATGRTDVLGSGLVGRRASGVEGVRNVGPTVGRAPGVEDLRVSAALGGQGAGAPSLDDPSIVSAARRQAEIEAARGLKRRFEYVLPERVGRALAADAEARGTSATTRLLEVLREAGYPVIPEDLVDLRKMPRR